MTRVARAVFAAPPTRAAAARRRRATTRPRAAASARAAATGKISRAADAGDDRGSAPGRDRLKTNYPYDEVAGPDAIAVFADDDAGDVLTRAWRSVVIVSPDVRSDVPFLGSSRHGSGVVVAIEGALGGGGGDDATRVVTAAHVASMAGPRNRLRVRAPEGTGKGKETTRIAAVVGVHPTLDVAVLRFVDDATREGGSGAEARASGGVFGDEFTPMPIATRPPRPDDVVAALGYPMGWSGAFKTLFSSFRGGGDGGEEKNKNERWGTTLATYAPQNGPQSPPSRDADAADENENVSLAPLATTHVLHTSVVANGESGGALINARGELVGVHSFGDAFFGGGRDVAVRVTRDVVAECGAGGCPGCVAGALCCPATPERYATVAVNARVMASSDPALAAMCPELSPAERRAWIL